MQQYIENLVVKLVLFFVYKFVAIADFFLLSAENKFIFYYRNIRFNLHFSMYYVQFVLVSFYLVLYNLAM